MDDREQQRPTRPRLGYGRRVDLDDADRAVGEPMREEEVVPLCLESSLAFRGSLLKREGIDILYPHADETLVAIERLSRFIGAEDYAAIGVDEQHHGGMVVD